VIGDRVIGYRVIADHHRKSSDRRSTILQLLHSALHQLLRIVEMFEDQGNVHFRLTDEPIAPAIDAVLADERERIGQQIERDGQTAAGGAHHRLVHFERVVVFLER
jgi:hypothetical protein